MRILDVRWVRLAIAAGAIAGSALVSSVAVAADESPPTEPPVTTTSDIASIEVDQSSADVIVVAPPPDSPIADGAVIEIVTPDPEVNGPGTVEPPVVEPMAVLDGEESADGLIAMTLSEPAAEASLNTDMMKSHEEEEGEGKPDHPGGSGGEGNPYHMTFTVVWEDADGNKITTVDVILTPEVLREFELSATSQTGKGMVTSATCTYPDGDMVLRCEFDNPGHGSGSDGMIIPARPTATYTVTVEQIEGWTIVKGANDDAYSARDLCREGGHKGGGDDSEPGGQKPGDHEDESPDEGGKPGGQVQGVGGEDDEGGDEGGGVPCVHTVVMRQVEPSTPPPPTQPPASPTPESGVVAPVATPTATTTTTTTAPPEPEPEPAAQSFATAPSSLPTTGGSISMIVLAGGVLVAMGSALAGLTRRTS
jgi:hypothetical protein